MNSSIGKIKGIQRSLTVINKDRIMRKITSHILNKQKTKLQKQAKEN